MMLKKGDVCSANLSGGLGHEQFGSRPAIVLTSTDTSIVIVVPVTSNLRAQRFSHTVLLSATRGNGLIKQSVALLFHIRAIDSRRIEHIIGHLSSSEVNKINKGIRHLLKI